jgi:hypothetical protein
MAKEIECTNGSGWVKIRMENRANIRVERETEKKWAKTTVEKLQASGARD